MLIVHAVADGELPLIWVEGPAPSLDDAEASPPPGAPVRPGRASRARVRHRAVTPTVAPKTAPPSPYAADPDRLAGRLTGFDTLDAAARRAVVLWLPTVDGVVLPSSPLIAEPADVPAPSQPTFGPWRVPGVRLPFRVLRELMARSLSERVFEPGIMPGPDLVWWANAMRFALALVARERFLPSLQRTPAGAAARWEPIVSGEDADELHELTQAMPAACRATVNPSRASATDAARVSRAIGALVDALVRDRLAARAAAGTPGAGARPRHTGRHAAAHLHDRWLAALTGADASIEGRADGLDELDARVREWARALGAAAPAPFALCFRLEEPPAIETDASEPEASGAAVVEAPAVADARWAVNYLLQSVDDPSLLIPVADLWRPAGRKRVTTRAGFEPRAFVLQMLGQAASIDPGVEQSLRASEPAGYSLDVNGAYEFLRDRAWALRNAGFRVILPAWWTRRGRRSGLTTRAKARSPRLAAGAQISLDQLVSVQWDVLLGETPLSRRELEALVALKTPLVRVRGQWVEISAEDRQHALRLLQRGPATASARSLLQLALGAETSEASPGLGVSGVEADGWLGELLERLARDAAFEELPQPDGFVGQLRPYQRRGYSWLTFLGTWGLGACLADDMGLGKTVQTLAYLQRYRAQGGSRPTLLVCPTSVVGNWQREAEKFVPDLPVAVHHGTRRTKGDAFATHAAGHALVVSSYALLRRDAESFRQVEWAGVVLDEAQNIKNPDTRQARAARALPADFRVALTGTPVENTVGDLWSVMEFLNPGLLGTIPEFKRQYFVPIQVNRETAAAERLKRVTAPFILRRLKTDPSVAPDLPDKLEMNVFCTLTREQATLYAAVARDAAQALEGAEGIKRKGVVLATLSKLKQVCNHPAQFLGDGSRIEGRSGKLARLTEMLEEVLATGERALVFTQFAQMGALIKTHVQDTFGREALFLHGATPQAMRDRMVQRFQHEADGPPVFVLSLKAGGTGLNLTAARHVFLFDRWWNPAVEAQAIDRAHRIGQSGSVQVHKFLCAGTVEEQINTILESKKDLAERIVGAGEAWLTELSTSELKKLFELRKDAVAE